MSKSCKYLMLALAAYQAKKFEDAGALFAQAAESEDVAKLSEDLDSLDKGSQEVPEPQIEDEVQESKPDQLPSIIEESVSADDEDDFGDEQESTSSVTRRTVRSMHQIGKILAASMEATASEEAEDEDEDEDEVFEPDPDLPGEMLVPASFSSVKVVGSVVRSPVKLKQ